MLERMEAERDEAGCALGSPDSENAALFAQLVVVKRVGGEHLFPRFPKDLARPYTRAVHLSPST
jgi:hypothetical protein